MEFKCLDHFPLFIVLMFCITIHLASSKSLLSTVPTSFQYMGSETFKRTTERMEAAPHIYPFQTALLVYNGRENHFCGGSLISDQWILTAAHCIDMNPDNILVFLGTHDLPDVSSMIILRSTRYVIHEDWNKVTLENDVALVKLPYNVTITDLVRPVELARFPDLGAGATGTVIGWTRPDSEDRTSIMLEDNCTVMANRDCAKTDFHYEQLIKPSHLCVNNYGDVKNYLANSGGPLLVDGVQVGIISFGVEDSDDLPLVFTRVASYYEWILINMAEEVGYRDIISIVSMGIVILCIFLLCVLQTLRYKRVFANKQTMERRLAEKKSGTDVAYECLR